jgi:hypothetical protein
MRRSSRSWRLPRCTLSRAPARVVAASWAASGCPNGTTAEAEAGVGVGARGPDKVEALGRDRATGLSSCGTLGRQLGRATGPDNT